MSEVSELIRHYVYEQRRVDLKIPLSLFTEEDRPLIEAGAFRKSEREADSIPCPFGCGENESVSILDYGDGHTEHFIVCRNGEGDKTLEPWEYEMMEFVPEVYFRNWTKGDLLEEPAEPKKKRVARTAKSTPFMKKQRDAVLNYVVKECGRTPESVTISDCFFVWNHPTRKKGWDRHAKFTDDKRGYGNPRLLYKGIRYGLKI